MAELLLLKGMKRNAAKKRKGGKKRRSAAQRAATAKMLAANKSKRNQSKGGVIVAKRKSGKRRKSSAKRVTRRASPVARKTRRSSRRRGFGGAIRSSGIVGMVKNGAIMGGGALAVDIAMGLVAKAAPTMPILTSRINADGSTNYGYFAAKIALAVALAKYGTRLTRHAPAMASGAIAVTAYELMRGILPQDGSIPLGSVGRGVGWFNPGRIATTPFTARNMSGSAGVGKVLQMGRIVPLSSGMTSSANRGVGSYVRRRVNR